jgi:hypothetical protein
MARWDYDNYGKRRKAFGAMHDDVEIETGRTPSHGPRIRPLASKPTCFVARMTMAGHWNIDGDRSVLIDNLANAVEVRDVQRRPVTVKYGDDGTVTLLVSREPIYVSGVSADVSLKISPTAPRNLRMKISLSAVEAPGL